MTPIAAPAPAPKAPPAPPKAADRDDRFAAMIADSDDAPQVNDSPAKDTPAKPAPAATAAATLAALIAAANGEATPAPAVTERTDTSAAPETKPDGDPSADPKAEAKPADNDAPAPPPVSGPTLPITAPVLAATPTPLAPAPHVAAPTAKVATKDEKIVTASATDAKATHAAPAPANAPPAKAETASTGDFKAALDATITPAQPHAATAHVPDAPVVTVRPGQMAADTGIQIARQINAGQNEFLLRLNPAEHGHIQIHMRFAEDGALRAVISADSATVLDMLRKDSGDLTRALGDAGVRTDAQSFSFGSQGQDSGQRQPRGSAQSWNQPATDQTEDTPLTRFRPLHGGLGVLDRLA
jgi:flagellar hook-length control protein FliK